MEDQVLTESKKYHFKESVLKQKLEKNSLQLKINDLKDKGHLIDQAQKSYFKSSLKMCQNRLDVDMIKLAEKKIKQLEEILNNLVKDDIIKHLKEASKNQNKKIECQNGDLQEFFSMSDEELEKEIAAGKNKLESKTQVRDCTNTKIYAPKQKTKSELLNKAEKRTLSSKQVIIPKLQKPFFKKSMVERILKDRGGKKIQGWI